VISILYRPVNVSLEMLLKLVAVFGTVIQSTVSARRVVGVDLHAEERYLYFRLLLYLHVTHISLFRESKTNRELQVTDLPKLFCGIAKGSEDSSTTDKVKEYFLHILLWTIASMTALVDRYLLSVV